MLSNVAMGWQVPIHRSPVVSLRPNIPKWYNANIFYFKKSRYQYSLKVIRSSSPNMFGTT